MIGEPGSGYRPIHNITQCVRNALKKADSAELADLELHSILFPLMGAGTTRSSAQEKADKLIDEAIEYLRQNPRSRIEKVYFLAYTEQDREILPDAGGWTQRVDFLPDDGVGLSQQREIFRRHLADDAHG